MIGKNVSSSSLAAKAIFLLVTSNVATLSAKTTNNTPWLLPSNKRHRRRPFHLPFCTERQQQQQQQHHHWRRQRVTSHGSGHKLTTISSILCIDPGGATNHSPADGGERRTTMNEETSAASATTDAAADNHQSPVESSSSSSSSIDGETLRAVDTAKEVMALSGDMMTNYHQTRPQTAGTRFGGNDAVATSSSSSSQSSHGWTGGSSRAVLTTPHRRMLAVRIAAGPRSSFSSPHRSNVLMSAEPIFVTKFGLSEQLSCHLRDLRIIDPKILTGGTAFLPRKNGIILRVGHVRAVIMTDAVLLFPPEEGSADVAAGPSSTTAADGAAAGRTDLGKVNELIVSLVDHLNGVYWSPSRREERRRFRNHRRGGGETNKENPAPFELVVLDALLAHVCHYETSRASVMMRTSNEILAGIHPEELFIRGSGGGGATTETSTMQRSPPKKKRKKAFMEMQSKLGELLPLKNRVDELEADCAEVVAAIAEVLKNDEDLDAMVSLSHPRSKRRLQRVVNHPHNHVVANVEGDNHQHVEFLFEDYLLQMDEILHTLRTIQTNVRNTEEVVEIELDLMRNRIMRYELLVEMMGFMVGCGAAITGLFGMNLVSHVEMHQTMFYLVSGAIVVLMVSVGVAFRMQLMEDNIY